MMNVLNVAVPNFSKFEEQLGLITPYSLWNTVDGPLFYRWMDLAYESDFDQIQFHLPAELPISAEDLALQGRWPVDVQWQRGGALAVDLERYEILYGDPGAGEVQGPWELVDCHWLAVTNRLGLLWDQFVPDFPGVRFGRLSRVDPTVRLQEPYWIGDECYVGPGAIIGPGTVISNGCVIGAGAKLEATYVGPEQWIAEEVVFDGYHLQDGVALNRKRRLDGLILDPALLRSRRKRPVAGWGELRSA